MSNLKEKTECQSTNNKKNIYVQIIQYQGCIHVYYNVIQPH